MTDTYNDTTGSRKKFLIPLVVLLLCAVSLTGAGYAYNSSVTTDTSDIDGKFFTLDTYSNDTGTIAYKPTDAGNYPVVFTTVTDHAADTTKVTANKLAVVLLGTIYVKINSNTDDTTATLTLAAETVEKATPTKAIGLEFDFTYKVYDSSDDLQFSTATGTINVGEYYKVEIYVQLHEDKEYDAEPIVDATSATDTAKDVVEDYTQDFKDSYGYKVTFSAEAPVTP